MPRRNRRAIAAPPLSNGVRHPSPVAVARIIHSGGATRCSEFERAPETASSRRHGGGWDGLRRGGSLDPPKFAEHKLHPHLYSGARDPVCRLMSISRASAEEEEEPNATWHGWAR